MTTTPRAPRSGRLQKAAALVPLAVLSTAWTVSVAGVGVTAVVSADAPTPSQEQLPEGATVPEQAIEAPASVSSGDDVAPGAPGNAQQIVDTASTNEIPAAALAAYQRAETVINAADTSCNLTWQLAAAIGRVESNHGRFGGNVLDEDGVARPGIYGIPLDGSNNTAVIRDTDAGQYDDDQVYDRAVGPMQFIPGTWSAIGVDADGDGERNPQDIDDAALGTAVYLCSGDDDLSTTAGQRSAVYRYNRSQSYVDLVLSVMNAYLDGDFMSVPTNTSAAGSVITPLPSGSGGGGTGTGPRGGGGGGGGGQEPVAQPGGEAPQAEPTEDPVPQQPDGGGDSGGDEGGGNNGGGGGGGNNGPVPPIKVPDLPDTNIPPVDNVLTLTQATLQCTLDGLNQLLNPQAFQQCVNDYMNP
ncbi:lytic transglycosylase domain-containing protein [Nocardioides nanhaiensis]|uniref:Transglycosylase SLT domain-containing protein n=1 Tax=Nocardioides nanhaiensis TaxID=1476871 RepID=A0ABP8W9J7_9ACTN